MGRGTFTADGQPPFTRQLADGAIFHELWSTLTSPAPIGVVQPEAVRPGDPLPPPFGGSRLRVVDIPPGAESPMHRTESIDYGVVLEGWIVLRLDTGEVSLGPGDVVIQRGSDHAWENRGAEPARILFVLLSGRFDDAMRALVPSDGLTHDME
jgi:quercetin dioxygenase-like cupin family protein